MIAWAGVKFWDKFYSLKDGKIELGCAVPYTISLPFLLQFVQFIPNFTPACAIREYGSTLYVGLARAVSPTNSKFRLTFLLTRLQEALYEDLAV